MNQINAQAPAIEWQKCLGGSGGDYATSIQSTTDGGSIVIGTTTSKDGDVTGNTGYYSIWVVKLSNLGAIQWQKIYGGSSDDYAVSIKETTDGGYIILANTNSTDGDVSGNHGLSDYWVIKTNNVGGIIWQKCYGGSDKETAYAIEQTSNGGYIIAGSSQSSDGDVTANTTGLDAWIVRLEKDGKILWQKKIGGSNTDIAKTIDQTSDGGYIVAGYSASKDNGISNYSNYSNGDYWVFKLSSYGIVEWHKNFGGTNSDEASTIKQTDDGGYIVCGTATSNDFDVTGLNNNSGDFWLVKLNNLGKIEWQKCFGGPGEDNPFSMQLTFNGDYIIAGTTWSTSGDVSGNHGSKDAWVVCVSKEGSLLWQKTLGGSEWEGANSIETTSDGGFLIGGYTNSNDGDVSGIHGYLLGADYWVVKLAGQPCTPTINITSTSTKLCSGNAVTFTATTTSNGNNATYQWKIRRSNVGTNSNIFTTSNLQNNDTKYV